MQLILVDRSLARARTLNLSRTTIVWGALGFLGIVAVAVAGLYAVTFRLAAQHEMPLIKQLVSVVMHDRLAQNEQYLRDNVSAMAKMVGRMQARLMRLDALGERVSKLAGIRPEESISGNSPAGRRGADASRPVTMANCRSRPRSSAKGGTTRRTT